MEWVRDRWDLRIGMLVLLVIHLSMGCGNVDTGAEPPQQGVMLQAQAVSGNTEATGATGQLHQVTLRITGMS